MAEIRMTEHQAQMTAVVRERVPVADLPQFFGRALHQTMSAVQAQGRHPVGPPFSLYHGMPTDAVDVEAGFPVDGPITAVDGVTPGSLPAGTVAEAVHVGPYESLTETYDAVLAHIQEQGLTPSSDMWEVYLSDPEQEPDPATWRTQIFWPVA
ncbi:MAG TPA: GyrI-like domain-containing protein [Intrasporangium sp.]|nr:GyrI-like domain-containing protein [Intrasporangium sp.]